MGKKRNRSESFTKLGLTDSGKPSDDGDSQEEYDIDAGLSKLNNGVRCSARVIEKQEKLRRESSPAKQSSATGATTLEHSPMNQQPKSVLKNSFGPVSSNVPPSDLPPVNDPYWDQTSPSPSDAQVSKNFSSGTPGTDAYSCPPTASFENKRGIEEKRKKRNWEVWSQDDKLHFFEALNEFGKDFDAIQNHLATKQKSRSRMALQSTNFVPKNKDQVRHFYYRTWHKIAKHLKFPKDMKRANQELYGLVNYGELRKRQRVLNVKNAAKLMELMEKGMTTIKVRGKTFRVKTPVCRAIKRMNLLEDEHSRVPFKICLELTPKDRTAWSMVQSVAHNPRVSVQVPPQRTLSSIITYFEERWKSPTERLKEQFVQSFGGKRVPKLRFIPNEQDARTPIFKMSESTNSATISLRSYTEKVLQKPGKELGRERLNSKGKVPRKQSGNLSDSHGEPDISDQEAGDPPKYSSNVRANSDLEEKTEESESEVNTEGPTVDNVSPTVEEKEATDRKFFQPPLSTHDNVCNCSPSTKFHVRDRESEDIVGHIWDDEIIRRGWSAAEAGLMTIGELHLMLGRCQRLSFTYCWDQDEQEKEPKLVDKLVEVARTLRKRKSMRTKSYNSYGAAVSCLKCGYPSDQFVPPTPVIESRAYELPQPVPSTVSGQDTGPSILVTNPSTSSYIQNFTTIPAIIIASTEPSVLAGRPAYVIGEPPPKPFMDLTKGNRRISRISRRVVAPRLPMYLQQEQNVSDSYASSRPHQLFEYGNSTMIPRSLGQSQTVTRVLNQDPNVPRNSCHSYQLPISSSELENLLKDKSNDKNVDPDNTFSLSSFMDISLPESTRLVADDVSLNVDRLLDDNTASSAGEKPSGLETPTKPSRSPEISLDPLLAEERDANQSAGGRWMSETNELSFTNLLSSLDTAGSRRDSQPEEEPLNFQSVLGDVSFATKFTEPPVT